MIAIVSDVNRRELKYYVPACNFEPMAWYSACVLDGHNLGMALGIFDDAERV